ncbi:MAG: hypothetical protein ACK55I_10495, partial [bacterium]
VGGGQGRKRNFQGSKRLIQGFGGGGLAGGRRGRAQGGCRGLGEPIAVGWPVLGELLDGWRLPRWRPRGWRFRHRGLAGPQGRGRDWRGGGCRLALPEGPP